MYLSTMVVDLITKLAWRLPYKTFYGRAGAYLTRFAVFKSDFVNVYLHCFHRSDEDPELHSHPWRISAALILSGGYREERRLRGDVIRVRDFRPGSINIIQAKDFHRVDLLAPDTWTLFVTGPKIDTWSFWNRDTKWVFHWRDFIRSKGLTPIEEAV